jgi:N-methylhydantoinase A
VTSSRPEGAAQAARKAYFGAEHGWLDTPVLVRADLAAGRKGPLIVEEYDSTCVVPPGAHAERDSTGNIVIVL